MWVGWGDSRNSCAQVSGDVSRVGRFVCVRVLRLGEMRVGWGVLVCVCVCSGEGRCGRGGATRECSLSHIIIYFTQHCNSRLPSGKYSVVLSRTAGKRSSPCLLGLADRTKCRGGPWTWYMPLPWRASCILATGPSTAADAHGGRP